MDIPSTTKQPCSKCGFTHSHRTCPAFNHECFNCHNTGHFTALCRRPCNNRCLVNTPNKCRVSRGRSHRSGSQGWSSGSSSRGRQTYRSTSCNLRYTSTQPLTGATGEDPHEEEDAVLLHTGIRSAIIMSFDSSCNEDQLYTDRAPDG